MSQTDRLYGLVGGAAIKVPCRVATTANITLSSLQTIDGIALAVGDRVLVKNQTTNTSNGIWVADTGDWERSKDFDGQLDVVTGTLVTVTAGTSNAWTAWRVTSADPVTIEGSAITFESALFSDAGTVTFTAAGVGAVQRTSQNKMRDIVSVKDFGATGDGTTNDTTAIQTAVTLLVGTAGAAGSALFFPATPNSYYKLTAAINLPNQNAYTLYGEGRRATKIYQATAGINAFTSSNVYTSGYNGITFRDLFIGGNGGMYGIYWKAMSRSQIIDCAFTGWSAVGGSAIRSKDSICVEIRGCEFASNYYDVSDEAASGSGSTSNAWTIVGNNFDGPGTRSINMLSMTGAEISGNWFQAHTSGAIAIALGQGINIGGNYFEGNYNSTTVAATSYDIFLGSSSYVTGCQVSGNYFASLSNTPGPATPENFYPVRIGYARELVMQANHVQNGTRWISFEAGANSVTNSVFGVTQMAGGNVVVLSSSHQTYKGIQAGGTIAATPMQFIKNGNRITDYVAMKNGGVNHFIGDFPYGGWSFGAAGASSFVRGPDTGTSPSVQGGRPVGLVHSLTAASTLTKTFDVAVDVTNADLIAKWCTFLVDVFVSDVAAKTLDITLVDNVGTTYTHLCSGQVSAGWQTFAVSGIFPATAVTVSARLLFNSIGEYSLANPRLYTGMDASVMPGHSGAPFWANTAAPTVGTWTRGDAVWNTTPSAGGTPGWMCTTTGTGGGALVFRAMAVLA